MKTRMQAFALVVLLVQLTPGCTKRSVDRNTAGVANSIAAKRPSLIEVKIAGPGIEKPGVYRVGSNAKLRDLLEQAVSSNISNNQYVINRKIGGGFTTIKLNRQTNPHPGDFELQDGDIVFASERLL